MKFLFDFFPLLLFFIAYKMDGIYTATAVAIAASFVQVGIYWFKHRRFETMHLVTLALIAIFGGLTLLFQDEAFIKWKPSVLNWLFGLVFLGSGFIGRKTLVERIMGASISLPDFVWPRINLAWALFFIGMGCANLYVISYYDTDTWVNFKFYGMTGLSIAFFIGQALYLARFMSDQVPVPNEDKEERE